MFKKIASKNRYVKCENCSIINTKPEITLLQYIILCITISIPLYLSQMLAILNKVDFFKENKLFLSGALLCTMLIFLFLLDKVYSLKGKMPMLVASFFSCHQRCDRSIHVRGKKMSICSRCLGVAIGFFLFTIILYFINISFWVMIIFLIPLILDGVLQLLTDYKSNNIKRFITGVLFSLGMILILSFFMDKTIDVIVWIVKIIK